MSAAPAVFDAVSSWDWFNVAVIVDDLVIGCQYCSCWRLGRDDIGALPRVSWRAGAGDAFHTSGKKICLDSLPKTVVTQSLPWRGLLPFHDGHAIIKGKMIISVTNSTTPRGWCGCRDKSLPALLWRRCVVNGGVAVVHFRVSSAPRPSASTSSSGPLSWCKGYVHFSSMPIGAL